MLGIILGTGDTSVNIAKIPGLTNLYHREGDFFNDIILRFYMPGCLVLSCMNLTLFDPLLDI